MAVSYMDLVRVHKPLREEIMASVEGLLGNGDLSLGGSVKTFEANFAKQIGCAHAVGVGSGSDAILLTLQSLGLAPGDEVICAAFGPVGAVQSVLRLGGTVVFVDINDNMTIDVEAARAAITERTKAIVAIHMFGLSVEIDVLAQIASDYGVYLIEDCAHACGAEWADRSLGTLGIAGTFDLGPTRNLGALGDAGAIITESDELADRLRIFRDQGRQDGERFVAVGSESRLDALQAGILDIKLQSLREDNEDRAANAAYYDSHLNKEVFTLPPLRSDGSHVYNSYVIRHPNRNELRSFLAERQIETRVDYGLPLHLQPCFEYLGYREGHFPQSELAAQTMLALPIYPSLSRKELEETAHNVELYAKTHPVEAAH